LRQLPLGLDIDHGNDFAGCFFRDIAGDERTMARQDHLGADTLQQRGHAMVIYGYRLRQGHSFECGGRR
jgi:hypothetical protein